MRERSGAGSGADGPRSSTCVHALDGSPRPFGDYQVTSSNGSSYTVEIRSLGTHINSCGCRDHRTNRLGTCKHIEGVLHRLRGNRAAPPRRRKPKGQESSGRIEIYLDERDDRAVRMTVPEAIERADPVFVQEATRHHRSLRRDSRKAFDALRDMARAHPDLLGPLFRFNREFYELDTKGRPSGFRSLDELAKRVSSVMLRRRKEDVESELPGRTVKTFFVPMTDTQTRAYEDYDLYVKRLAALAAKRPLTKEEFDRLQKFLACMRMICDTPWILGEENRDCPKMEEIERLLPDLLDDPERKIIVFSEWVRMLELVREYAAGAGIEFAWHTGSVPQPQRRAEIRRFRDDPECRLFLSSESGGVGLNLQVADTVVNMDLPWNPARLEQRIARAWRKHQTRPVTVINLVSEYTIEHRMLGLLDAKRTLAEGVLDQRGDLSEIPLPTGRAAFMERLDAVLGAQAAVAAEGAARALTAVEQLRDDLVVAHGATLRRLFVRDRDETVLVVLALPPERIAEEERRLGESTALNVKVIDPATHESMLRLAEAGLIALPGGELREVYPASGAERSESDGRLLRAKALTDRAEHKLKAAVLLVGGGFAEEARAPAVEAARLAVAALAAMRGKPEPGDAESAAEFLLGEEPEGIPGGPPHDAIRALSGDEPEDGEVARIEEFVSRISWMVSDMTAPSRGAAG